jgi:hypothetical protein
MPLKKNILILCLTFLVTYASAQEGNDLKGNALGASFEEGWYTRTIGAFFRNEAVKNPWAIGIRVYGLRNSRERLVNAFEIYTQPGNRFVYGKQHRMLAIAPFYERSINLINHGEAQLFDFHLFAQAGPILGLQRPYYVEVFRALGGGGPGQPISGITEPTPFNPEIDYIDIVGRSQSLEYGWDDLQIVPGASLRLGARIGLARYERYLTELVFSVQGDYLFQPVDILVSQPGQQFFPNLSIGLVIGSRW